MTVTAGNPPLQGKRIVRPRKHLGVVVALQNQTIATGKHIANMCSDFADIRQDAEAKLPVRKNILNRLTCIVGHGKSLHAKLTDFQVGITVDDTKVDAFTFVTGRISGAMRHPDRQRIFSGEAKNATQMITMLMRHQYSGQAFRFTSRRMHSGYGIP